MLLFVVIGTALPPQQKMDRQVLNFLILVLPLLFQH